MSLSEMALENQRAAEAHVKRVVGPTILLGDGSYYDFEAPFLSSMTAQDYAWGLLANNRFRGQTRQGPRRKRCLYNVLQHVVLLAEQMQRDGHSARAVYQGLMHESDEVPWGDFPGPAKSLMPAEFRAIVKHHGDAIDQIFSVPHEHKDLVKRYDIRMLVTEKRDLMPHSASDAWEWTRDLEPFPFRIEPWSNGTCVGRFMRLYRSLVTELGIESRAG